MTPFLIAALVAAVFVIGQFALLRPGLHETRLMAMRQQARQRGLNPRLLAPPEWYRGPRPAGGMLACYSLFAPDSAKGLPPFRMERLSDGDWIVKVGPRHLKAALTLPPEAEKLLALEAQANAVSLWWTESLGAEVLPTWHALLAELMEKLQKEQGLA